MIAEENQRMSAAALTGLLARRVERVSPSSGDHRTALPELTLHRRNRPSQPVHCIYTLGMALTTQGAKHVIVGDRSLSYGPGQSLLTTIDLPVSYHITRATSAEPYLGVMLKFDRTLLAEVASTLDFAQPKKGFAFEPISIQRLDAATIDALYRLVAILDEPTLLPHLAPMAQKEILYRVLTGPHGPHLRYVMNAANPSQQVTQSVSWIRQHFAEEIRVDDLARNANMSPTTFRQRFHLMTGMSPVQYQKLLRLQEARQLMLDQKMTAGSASALVGYESPSQFNREYRRLFGASPLADIKKISTQG